MKYIRTKDGRIVDLTDKDYIMNGNDLILHEQYNTVGGLRCKKDYMIQASIAVITKHNEYKFVGTIENQADTIEELCDVLILKSKNYRGFKGELKLADLRNGFGTKEDLHNYLISQMKHTDLFEVAYLGIETSKGLIYVAKMNEKGEMELL